MAESFFSEYHSVQNHTPEITAPSGSVGSEVAPERPYADPYAAMRDYNFRIFAEKQCNLRDPWLYTVPALDQIVTASPSSPTIPTPPPAVTAICSFANEKQIATDSADARCSSRIIFMQPLIFEIIPPPEFHGIFSYKSDMVFSEYDFWKKDVAFSGNHGKMRREIIS